MKFSATLLLSKKTATGIAVPEEIVVGLNAGKKPAVTVTIGDNYTYRSSIATMDGKYMIPVSAEHREGAGIAAGDELEIELALDTEPREVEVPDDLAGELERNEAAQRFFASLSYSNKRRIVLQITDAKTAETRRRRVDKAIAQLNEGKI